MSITELAKDFTELLRQNDHEGAAATVLRFFRSAQSAPVI